MVSAIQFYENVGQRLMDSVQRYRQLLIIFILYANVFDRTSKRQQLVDPAVRPGFPQITRLASGRTDFVGKLNGHLAHRSSGKQENFIFPFLVAEKCEPGNAHSIIIQKKQRTPIRFSCSNSGSRELSIYRSALPNLTNALMAYQALHNSSSR